MQESISSFNATDDLLLPNILAGRSDKIAIIDDSGEHTYAQLVERVNRFANVLTEGGIDKRERILLCLEDGIDFHTCFLGAIKAGVIPVPVNPLLSEDTFAFILEDTQSRMLVMSESVRSSFAKELLTNNYLEEVIISGQTCFANTKLLTDMLLRVEAKHETVFSQYDDPAFWLYTSGTTGRPNAAVHKHISLRATAENYGIGVLGMKEDDVVYSAAKLFFAYGLGNSLSFPLLTGATTILVSAWSKPNIVIDTINKFRPTIFLGVPTLFAGILNSKNDIDKENCRIKYCASAGEAMPSAILKKWRRITGIDIIDGIGSTEMLHIFISNRVDDNHADTSGSPVDAYKACLIDESGQLVAQGDIGDLYVTGPSIALKYWERQQATEETFLGTWLKTGDKYRVDDNGYYVHCGRSDDMFKVSAQYVIFLRIPLGLRVFS